MLSSFPSFSLLSLSWHFFFAFLFISCFRHFLGLRQLASSPQAWALVMAASVCQGVPGTWMAMMVTNLTKVN